MRNRHTIAKLVPTTRIPIVLCALYALNACQQVPQPLDEATIRRVLEHGAHSAATAPVLDKAVRQQLLQLYHTNNFVPLWLDKRQPTAAALDLIRELRDASARGLDPRDYLAEPLSQQAQDLTRTGVSRAQTAIFDATLTLSAARLICDLRVGRVDPRDLGHHLPARHRQFDLAAAVTALAKAQDTTPVLDRYEPAWNQYHLLKRALAQHRASATLDASRVRRIELALEHWRWMPPRAEGPVIIVNVPQFELFVYEVNGTQEMEALKLEVAVGSAYPETKTPVLSDQITYLVLWPYWNVPESIVREELWPKILMDARWFDNNDFEIVIGLEKDAEVLQPTPDVLALVEQGEARLRQRPGPGNALGRIKFMLPNRHNIYLHDTPAKTLFKETRRDFSHGCIRLADPVALANYLLRDDRQWDRRRLQVTLAAPSDTPLTVLLEHPVPIHIIYATAYVTGDGQVHFFEDLYGHDAKLEDALRYRSGR